MRAKPTIDDLVTVIESGDLYVTDNWTVLVRPVEMTPEMANLMALAAQGFQTQLNEHLITWDAPTTTSPRLCYPTITSSCWKTMT